MSERSERIVGMAAVVPARIERGTLLSERSERIAGMAAERTGGDRR